MENFIFCAVWNFKFDSKIKGKLFDKFTFCKWDLIEFVLLLIKAVYPYKYMDSWARFDEDLLPNKEMFYSNMSIEDNKLTKLWTWEDMNHLRNYHDFCF